MQRAATPTGVLQGTRVRYHRLMLGLLAGLIAVPAFAALQTISGSSFDLTYDDTRVGLFGAPSLVGNTIFFTPGAFIAESTNGAGVDLTTSTINFILAAKPGFSFGTLALVERGDYRLNGIGSTVGIGGQLIAFDESDPIGTYSFDFIDPNPAMPLIINNATLQPWRGDASLKVSQLPFFDPTVLRVAIQNQLTATTTAAGAEGSYAFIQKKFTGAPVTLEVLPVPVPGALWLFVAGVGPLLGFARRR